MLAVPFLESLGRQSLTVALYTRLAVVHFPGRGRVVGSQQLHFGRVISLFWFNILKLYFAIVILNLGRYLCRVGGLNYSF